MKLIKRAGACLPMLLCLLVNAMPCATAQNACVDEGACPGLQVSAGYIADLRRNATGGLERGNAASGLLQLGAAWTTDRLLPGAWITSTASLIHTTGGAISGRYVGDLQGLNNIEAPAALRLYELWSEARFGGDDGLSTRMGFLDLNAEFDAPVTSAFFIGPPFGIGTDLAQTGENGPAVFPVTSLGLRVAGRIGAAHWRMAAFDGVPGRVDRNRFAAVNLSRGDGALLIAEVELAPAGFNKLAAGLWSYTSRFDAIDAAARGDHRRRAGNRGGYAVIDAPLGQIGGVHLAGVVRAGAAAGRFNAVDGFLGAALVASHLSAARPDDAIGVAVAHGRTSSAFQRQQFFDGLASRDSETQVELTWRSPVQPWMAIVPSLQWVAHPGADRAVRDALVVGLRFEMNFDRNWPLLARRPDHSPSAPLVMTTP